MINKNLKLARKSRKMKISAAADLLGISALSLILYEMGIKNPDSKFIIKCSNAYNYSCYDLLSTVFLKSK